MYFTRPYVAQTDVFDLLSNERRRRSIEHIAATEETTLRALADAVAAEEAGTDTPPDAVRTAVYVSLRQVHLPRLAEAGLVEFDPDENTVRVLPRARGVTLYLELVTRYGVTWGECYQYLGIAGFLTVLGSLLALPVLDALPPLLWTTVFLALFAAVSAYQLLADRLTPAH
ncbi:hypothetical protein [Salarchaeum sp. JOR-1]|uniref:DUF7344 domain-containing protein n=1 Tax=Salarchaeum sp. JOR-1 TaxID=2599399 RepID=UPI001198AD8F|nr:hypothetical protein [Salarchaeum sp. JOR-1]QDX39992.1 hypothetical protein FQU85_03430 [Salarchaeum sp. JOR-1]